jgi:Uma2 family endonuclease
MSLDITRKHVTLGEFRRMAEAGVFAEDERIELVRGELINMTPIGPGHAYAVRRLTGRLSGIPGTVLDVQNPLLMPGDSELYPDLALLRARPDDYPALPRAADAVLVVEVANTSLAYDRQVKVPLYAQGGAPEVWLVDLSHTCLWVYRQAGAHDYLETHRLERGKQAQALGISINVDELFTQS